MCAVRGFTYISAYAPITWWYCDCGSSGMDRCVLPVISKLKSGFEGVASTLKVCFIPCLAFDTMPEQRLALHLL